MSDKLQFVDSVDQSSVAPFWTATNCSLSDPSTRRFYETTTSTTNINDFDLPERNSIIRTSSSAGAGLSRSGHSKLLQMVRACVESNLGPVCKTANGYAPVRDR